MTTSKPEYNQIIMKLGGQLYIMGILPRPESIMRIVICIGNHLWG